MHWMLCTSHISFCQTAKSILSPEHFLIIVLFSTFSSIGKPPYWAEGYRKRQEKFMHSANTENTGIPVFPIVIEQSSPLVSRTLPSYWFHQDGGSKPVIKDKRDKLLELMKTATNGEGRRCRRHSSCPTSRSFFSLKEIEGVSWVGSGSHTGTGRISTEADGSPLLFLEPT